MKIALKLSSRSFKKAKENLLNTLDFVEEILCKGVDIDSIAYQHNVQRDLLVKTTDLISLFVDTPIRKKMFITANELSKQSGISGQKIRAMLDSKEMLGQIIPYGKKKSYLVPIDVANAFIKKYKNQPHFYRSKAGIKKRTLVQYAAGIEQTMLEGRFRTIAWMRPAYLVLVQGLTHSEAAYFEKIPVSSFKGSTKKLYETINKLSPKKVAEMQIFLGTENNIDVILTALHQRWLEHKIAQKRIIDGNRRQHYALKKLDELKNG